MTAPVRIRARGWGWRHGTRRAAALDGVDLDVAPGERVLLLGPSGAGKSTLLAALAGVLGGDEEGEQSGDLTLDGVPPAAARGRAGLVLQDPESQVVMARVGDEVAFGCENLGVPAGEIWPRVGAALDAVGLALPLDHSTSELSGGQKQRLALASVLAMRPGLLLLDEPTAQIDPAGAVELRDAVARAVDDRRTTLVVVEHRVALWLDLVDRIVVLGRDGRLVADGPPAEVLRVHGAALAADGVWVPDLPPAAPPRHRPAQAPLLLAARGLRVGRRRFGDRHPIEVAGPLDVEVEGGRVLAVTGPNGAGKSTLALTLAGLQPPAGGELTATPTLADGLSTDPLRWRSRQLLTRIGTVFQDPRHQFLAATVRAELELGPRLLRLPDAEVARRTDELLQRLRLDALAAANPFTLSGGEQRRLSVATAIATAPRILVVDEPTFGQDARTWAELAAALGRLVDDGTALVAVSHDTPFVDALADRVLALPARRTVVKP